MRPRENKYDWFWIQTCLTPEPLYLNVLGEAVTIQDTAQWTSAHLSLHLLSAPWPKMIWQWNLRWHYLTYQWSSKKEVLITTPTSSVSPRITQHPLVTEHSPFRGSILLLAATCPSVLSSGWLCHRFLCHLHQIFSHLWAPFPYLRIGNYDRYTDTFWKR